MRTVIGLLGLLSALCGCTGGDGKPEGSATPGGTAPPAAKAGPGISTLDGPFVHENLALYVVRGKATDTRDYITLDEGLAARTVVVQEKGAADGQDRAQVNTLEVENRSDRWLFLQAGDVVKGGKQDRTIGIDIALEPRSKPRSVDSFCVEHGRWTPDKAGLAFEANTTVVGSNALKMSIQGARDQSKVWEEVAKQDRKAAAVAGQAPTPAVQPPAPDAQGVAQPDASLSSTGTYNAIVENGRIRDAREAYVKALMPRVEAVADGLGIVVAVNGKVMAADVYGSSALYRKIVRKLVESYAQEAALARDPEKKEIKPPARDEVLGFLAEPEKAEGKGESLAGSMHRSTRETGKAVRYEYRDRRMDAANSAAGSPDAAPVHQNYLAK